MSDKASSDIRALAEQVGLDKAFELAPEIVAACAERGQHPFSKPPAELTPLTAPAAVFNPAAFVPKS